MPYDYCGYESKSRARITGIRARITTRASNLGDGDNPACATWIGLRGIKEDNRWLQLGYAHQKDHASDPYLCYMEAYLPNGTHYAGPVELDKTYQFSIERMPAPHFRWNFLMNGNALGRSTPQPDGWRPNEFLLAQFYGEAQGNSSMAGDDTKSTVFSDCQVQYAFGAWQNVNLGTDFNAVNDVAWNHLVNTGNNAFQIYSD